MTPQARAQIARWGLTEQVASQAGLFETPSARLLWPDLPAAPAIVIPYLDPATQAWERFQRGAECLPFARLRWLSPMPAPGAGFLRNKPQRYTQPKGSPVLPYFAPGVDWRSIAADPKRPVILTEGEAKALCALQYGFTTIAFGGVYSFADRRGELLPLLAGMAWEGRDVYICYDSDAATNPDVLTAEARLVDALQRQRGARVRIVRLGTDAGEKVGLDDFLARAGPAAFAKLLEITPALSAIDGKVIALNKDCAWIEREAMIWDRRQHLLIRKESFLSGSHHSTHIHIIPGLRKPHVVNIARTWLNHPHAARYSEILFRPGGDAIVTTEHGQPALNLWEDPPAEPGDVTPFLELNTYLCSRMPPEQRELPLKLLAYKAQNPAAKIPLAIVVVGWQGSGKSYWGGLLARAFGPHGAMITAEQMLHQFNGWLERTLVAVVNDVPRGLLRDKVAQIRTLISEPMAPMEEKFRPIRTVYNYAFLIINSNFREVASYEADDRRMIVVDCPRPLEDAFYDRLKAWDDAGGPAKLMHYLLNYPLAGWTPPKKAPLSPEKAMAHREGLTVVQELAHEMLTADQSMVLHWLESAEAWAIRAEVSSNINQAAFGSAVRAGIGRMHIRPWYTPQELAMLLPTIIEQTQGSRFNPTTAVGRLSRELRDAGIPYLRCSDNPSGFHHRGQLKQYLVVSDFEAWDAPISQAEFDAQVDKFPTYDQVKTSRRTR